MSSELNNSDKKPKGEDIAFDGSYYSDDSDGPLEF